MGWTQPTYLAAGPKGAAAISWTFHPPRRVIKDVFKVRYAPALR